MEVRYEKMIRRVGKQFYQCHIDAVRQAVAVDLIGSLIERVSLEHPDIKTVVFRIRAMASAVRQGYDL